MLDQVLGSKVRNGGRRPPRRRDLPRLPRTIFPQPKQD
jgi:hypothetical protein